MAGALCVKCGVILAKVLVDNGVERHPNCEDSYISMAFGEPEGPDPLKTALTEIVMWADRNAERSLQVALGASELGSGCDRRIGYRIAGIPAANTNMDPWPAIVGTGIHDWLENAVNRFQAQTGCRDWMTETRVQPDPLIRSRSDLYHIPTQTVVDYKSAGKDKMAEVQTKGVPPGYEVQIHTYGLGYQKMGYPVKDVALVFLPRCGWLRDMYVWRDRYKPEVAEKAIARMYSIGAKLAQLDIMNNPHRWAQVEANPNYCNWCPMFVNRELERGADATGCPGG